MHTTCGYCGGRGFILGSMYDADGYQRFHEPPRLVCEYCGGYGQCAEGDKLLAAREPKTDEQSSGNPCWA